VTGRALVDYGRLLDVLGIEAELLAETASGAAEDASVPACPGLTLGETVRHVGGVYRAVHAWVEGGQRPAEWPRQPLGPEGAAEFVRSGLRSLVEMLSAHAPEERCSTWWPEDETYGFWRRRMTHETTVHRVDVQDAAGIRLTPVAEDIALDGVDEVLMLWFGHRLGLLGLSGNRETSVAIRSGGREWVARTNRERATAELSATSGETAADATVSGDPMQIYLWLWGRRPTRRDIVQTEGDDDAVAQLWALLRLATR
jgi:uncharacterized protein (TIGR03083 family)